MHDRIKNPPAFKPPTKATMHLLKAKARNAARILLATCAVLALAQQAQATPVTQTTAAAGSDSYYWLNGWQWLPLGGVTLATGTNAVLGLTSTVTLVDQGWGGQDPNSNQVVIGLLEDGVGLWFDHVAGATHVRNTQSFDIANDPSALASLNAGLTGIDWTHNPTVTMQMFAVPLSYGGWELHTSGASFSVTSDAVPEPASLALAGLALVMASVVSLRRKRI